VKIVERRYAPWAHARQAQLDADLDVICREDPLFRAKMLRTEMAVQDGPTQRRAATRSQGISQLTEYTWFSLVSRAGLEPATLCLKGKCSTD
jgi:hypothetical protein